MTCLDLSNEPILAFSDAQANQTYLAAALSFLVQSPTDTQADSFDPLQLFSASSIFLSYLQTSMQSRTEQSTILSSQINPLVPFQLPEPSCDEDILVVILVSDQPHPLLAEDCYVKQFAAMEEDSSKRRDYQMGGFWESAALGEVSAATWILINNDKAECQNGGEDTAGGEGPEIVSVSTGSADTTTTITTTVDGKPTTITTTIPAASSGASNSSQAAVDGGAAVQTTTITTVVDGKPTTITTTIPASSVGVDGESGAFVGGPQGGEAVITTTITTEINGTPTCITTTVPATSASSTSGENEEVGANGNNARNKQSPEITTTITTTITSTGTTTTVSGSSTITTTTTTTFVSTITSPAPASSSGAVAGAVSDSDTDSCDGKPDGDSNNENEGENGPSESESYVTSVKTITKTTTDDKGSKVEQVTTTTETSAIVNVQAPVEGAAGGPNPAEPSTTSTSSGQSSLKEPLPTGLGADVINNSTNTIITTTSSTTGLNGNDAPSAGAAENTQPPVQTAGAVDTEPAVVAAVLMGSLGGFYFAFL